MSAGIRFGVATAALVVICLLVYRVCLQYFDIADTSVVDNRVIGFTEISQEQQPALLFVGDDLLSGELEDQRALVALIHRARWWMALALAVGIAVSLLWLYRVAPPVSRFLISKLVVGSR
jgi:hypothetical protein